MPLDSPRTRRSILIPSSLDMMQDPAKVMTEQGQKHHQHWADLYGLCDNSAPLIKLGTQNAANNKQQQSG